MAGAGARRARVWPGCAWRCQRAAALAAVAETGHRARARAHFRELGCRWYHLPPDQTVDNPLCFFAPEFLRVTFLPGKG